jgi:hypothetical protein
VVYLRLSKKASSFLFNFFPFSSRNYECLNPEMSHRSRGVLAGTDT